MLSGKDHNTLSDTELVSQYKVSGDLALVGALFNRYMTLVYGVCKKYFKDREASRDAVMQIFEKLIVSLREHEVTHFKSWLYVTSKNHCLMALRAKKGRNFQVISSDFMENESFIHLQEEPEMETNLVKLERCIEKLVTEQKDCVTLFYMQQKCYKEIVEITGFDDNKVKSYIQNGKRNLKLCMERNE
ncbi:sigma-70 family RNA polymerase sigma factor [Chryseolinea sp. H1M3-3]|uniref:RNA polymerase sigma factor n=1 Tax=Chryseolinea sp. H1M3-3 TaxID=3034144 RepID=UPI0023ECF618|nr:sigma-70 family RNA polymerase sigma factor [Chryseolinea sp. H1M3-3]